MADELVQHEARVVCGASKDPAIRLFIVAGMLLGFGVWCLRDGMGLKRPTDWSLANVNEVAKYVMNVYGPYLFIPLGVIIALWAVVFLRRVLIADGAGIGYQGKGRLAWSDVDRLDATELKTKGVLYLEHGKGERMTVDSWKLQNFRDLVIMIEKHVPPEKRVVQ